MRSRVIPGSFVTIERRVPVRRLNRVDLPTLGRPTITMDASCAVMAGNKVIVEGLGVEKLKNSALSWRSSLRRRSGRRSSTLRPRENLLQFQTTRKQARQFGRRDLRFDFLLKLRKLRLQGPVAKHSQATFRFFPRAFGIRLEKHLENRPAVPFF